MSQAEWTAKLTVRARKYAMSALVVACVILLLAVVSAAMWQAGRWRLDMGVLQAGASFLKSVLNAGIEPALGLVGMAILVLAAVRIASEPGRRYWAPELEEKLVKRAFVVADFAEIFAWVYLAFWVIGAAFSLYQWAGQMMSMAQSSGEGPHIDPAFRIVELATSGIALALTSFLGILMGVGLVRVLLVIAMKRAAASEESPAAPEGRQ